MNLVLDDKKISQSRGKNIHCKGCNQHNYKIHELLEVSALTFISLMTDFQPKRAHN